MSIVNLTEQAKQHMATMLKEHNKPAIRLGLKGGGCAGFKYEWSLEDNVNTEDEQIKIENGLFVDLTDKVLVGKIENKIPVVYSPPKVC